MLAVCTTLGYDFIRLSKAGLGQYLRGDLQESPWQEVVLVIQRAVLSNWASLPNMMDIQVLYMQ